MPPSCGEKMSLEKVKLAKLLHEDQMSDTGNRKNTNREGIFLYDRFYLLLRAIGDVVN